jgi:hypothetical protein
MCGRNNYCMCRHKTQYIKKIPASAEEKTTACADITRNTFFFKSCMCGRNNYCMCRHKTQYIKKIPASAEEKTTACADITRNTF